MKLTNQFCRFIAGTASIAVLLHVVCIEAISLTSSLGLPDGVLVTKSSGQTTIVHVQPSVAFDTVATSDGLRLRSKISGGRVRQNSDGSVIQIVIPVSFPITSTSIRITSSTASKATCSLPLLIDRSPSGKILHTAAPLSEQTNLAVTGIGRGTQYATLDVVVAETKNGATTVYPRSTVQVQEFGGMPMISIGKKVSDQVQALTVLSPVAKLTIPSEGVYRLTAQQLRDAGLPTDASAAKSIKVLGWGGLELSEQIVPALNETPNEQDIIVNTNADGSIAEVLFYANGSTGWSYVEKNIRHYLHHYDRDAHYLVTTAGEAGKRCVARSAAQGTVANNPLQVQGFAFNEDEMVNPYNSGSGRKWLGRTVENGGSMVVTLPLPGLIRTGGSLGYRAVVAHRGTVGGTFTVYEGNTPVMQRLVSAIPEYMDTYSVEATGQLPATELATDSRSMLRFEYQCADKVATGLLDWVEVLYPRGMIADNQSFSFFTAPELSGITEYSINGFGNSAIYIFDVTSPTQPKLVQNAAPAGGLAVIREQLDSGIVRQYYATANIRSATLSPLPALSLRSRAVANDLRDMIIITHPNLLESAKRYAQYREAQGEVGVSVVTTEEIMNEFGYGSQDPTAIRDFLGFAYRNASNRPKYVLLWGDGHYDFKNLLTTAPNFVLPYESLDPDDQAYGLSTYTSDDFFVRVDGQDARPDLAIGRLPVTSNEVGDHLREKIDHYEHNSSPDDWRTKVTLMADDGPTSDNKTDGSMHLDQSEELSVSDVPKDFQEKKIYLVEYPTDNVARGRRKPGASNDLVSTINTSGSLLLNWIGHGNPRVWAHEFAFERETTPQRMTNWDKLFFLTAATCDFARFDMTDVQSGAEELMLHETGGAVGVFSSARVVFSYANAALNQAFYSQLFTQDSQGNTGTLGDVLYIVKQQFTSDNDEKYFLMADPTMRLLIPNNKVVFETINGSPLSDTSLIHLQALQTVTITGHVSPPASAEVASSFTGIVTISLLDGDRKMQVVDNDVKRTLNKFTLPGALLSRGSFKVENGMFSATFVVPKDIAFSSSTAKLFGYAIADNKQTARGVTSDVIVDGISSEQHNDPDGPSIAIYLDSRFFSSGQVVRNNPILLVDLEDATGINAAGVGVGHDIEATFDEGSQIEVLTETFATSLDNPKAGTASKQIFGLAPGLHTVKVRAWDVLNNSSEASTTFRIPAPSDGVVSSWLMNYPNPFSSITTIRFQHNVSQPFTAEVAIHDMQGRLIQKRDMPIREMQTAEIQWDGKDSEGYAVGSGVYLCSVRVTDFDGRVGMVYGKLALIR